MKKCPKCKNEIPEDSVFCHYCGCDIKAVFAEENICPSCGKGIEPNSKFCSFCGGKIDIQEESQKKRLRKNHFVDKFKSKSRKAKIVTGIVSGIVLIILAAAIYVGVNYSVARNALYNYQYEKAVKHFDNLLIAESFDYQKYICAKLGASVKEDDYQDTQYFMTHDLKKLSDESLQPIIMDIKEAIYINAKQHYAKGASNDYELTRSWFALIRDYKWSEKYINLINIHLESHFGTFLLKYDDIAALIGFEDANETVMNNESVALKFLEGKWETQNGKYYFRISEDGTQYQSYYNLPFPYADGYFTIDEGIYSVGEDDANRTNIYRISIHSENIIQIYCYENGCNYVLYRQ